MKKVTERWNEFRNSRNVSCAINGRRNVLAMGAIYSVRADRHIIVEGYSPEVEIAQIFPRFFLKGGESKGQ